MNFTPHSEQLLGASFKRIEFENQISDRKEKVREKSLKELSSIDKKYNEIRDSKISVYMTACLLSLGIGLAAGAIPWIIFVFFILSYSSLISNTFLMISFAIVSLTLGLIFSTLVGKIMFKYITAPNTSDIDKKMEELIEKKQILMKNITD